MKSADDTAQNARGGHNALESSRRLQVNSLPLLVDPGFNAVFDSSGEALLVVDRKGLIQQANRRAREMLRLRDSFTTRAGLLDFLVTPSTADFSEFTAQAGTSSTLATRDAMLATGFPIRITLRAALPGSQSVLLCLEDGSLVQRAERKARQMEAEISSVLDAVEVAIVLFDPTGRLRFSNARFAQYFSLDVLQVRKLEGFEELETLVAKRFRDPDIFSAPWRSFAGGDGVPRHDELEMTRPSKRVLERFSRPVLDGEGRRTGWLELYNDVTGEREIQSKLLQTEKMAALGQLVSGIAHELNNPLTTIMGYGQLLLGHGLTPPQLSEARKVFQEAERARRIVKNLLYFARENRPERTRVNLNEIVERTLALRSYELRVENIVIECDLAQNLPETMADPHQLQQVVLNLLANAEQALLEDRGQGHVWIRTQRIGGNRISLEVSDDGPGIPTELGSRIFDPFFTTKPSDVGTGLGLSIVYGIVHQHGGEVTFENQSGAGARFVVELPLVSVQTRDPAASLDLGVEREPNITRGRILVVEDEPTVAQLMVDVLREEGHQVEAVMDSQEGLTLLSRGSYDLILCDLRMPRLDGPAFYDTLVRAGSAEHQRIIFVTGDTLAPRTLEFLEANKLPYLSKPFLVEELKLAVNCRLQRTQQAEKPSHSARPIEKHSESGGKQES
ncbi:MAG TPA: ATP-binding protein [Candidatus Acidoferrales bacterium]|jgi:signal transduction histidine kinase/FixJ family two-component response regulator|nr:ATP-binding protein [Candidatus Acidoferrales bacterium]